MQEDDLVRGICGARGRYETAEVCDVRRIGGGAGCFLDDLRAFGINADLWTTAVQDEEKWLGTLDVCMYGWMDGWMGE